MTKPTTIKKKKKNKDLILAQKQTCRSMEQNKEPRNKPTHLYSVKLTKEAKMYNEVKTVFSTSGGGKIGQLHVNQ